MYVQLLVYNKLYQERRNTNTVHKSVETDKKKCIHLCEEQKGAHLNLHYKNVQAVRATYYTLFPLE